MGGFRSAPAVRHGIADGLVVVLDLVSDAYLALDSVASAMWLELVGGGRGLSGTAAERLAAELGAEPARVAADLEAFAAECVHRRLLVPAAAAGPLLTASPLLTAGTVPAAASGAPRPVESGVLLAARAWRELWRASRMLRRRGLAATYERAARLSATSALEADEALLGRAVRAFSVAENAFVSRRAPTDCLPRSLALFCYLRSLGVEAAHVVGVRRVPFEAHAWVERAGVPLLDEPARVRGLTTIARLGQPS